MPVLLILLLLLTSSAFAEFPNKPIKFVVYTNPGGLIDVSVRKLAGILEEGEINQSVVVENKKGAGGLVAIEHVLRQPADGLTVFALTSSVVSKAIETGRVDRLLQLEMLARLVDDYECLIVKKGGKYQSLGQLVKDLQSGEDSIWVGPAVGGTDHLFALKFWKEVKGKGSVVPPGDAWSKHKWIPYKSGGEAVAALMGGHGDVYVGNPQDVQGRPNLKVLAVASPKRLEKFPEAPTFEESGFPSITGESLWRGLAVRKDTPEEAKSALIKMIQGAVKSDQWATFVEAGGATAIFETGDQFSKTVKDQIATESELLQSMKASS